MMPKYKKYLQPFIPKEYTEQALVITWARSHQIDFPCLEWLHSSMNGVRLSKFRGARAKAEGMVKGIFDLHLPYPNSKFHGFYLEMKRLEGGRVSVEQKKYLNYLLQHGYFAVVCKGHLEAIKYLKEYLEMS